MSNDQVGGSAGVPAGEEKELVKVGQIFPYTFRDDGVKGGSL